MGSSNVIYRWPNSKTVFASVSIIVNIACVILQTSKKTTLLANVPARVVSSILHRHEYSKVIFEVAAFAALFLPYGPWISIAIDVASEFVNFFQYRSKKPSIPSGINPQTGRPWLCKVPITPAVLRSMRSFLDADERCRQDEIKARKPHPPLTEAQARRLLELPSEGFVDLTLAKKNWEEIIKEFQGRVEKSAKSSKWIYELRIKEMNEAYEIICRIDPTPERDITESCV
jgi:hypothetical protein